MYANPNCKVVGTSFTRGKPRFHGVNVPATLYEQFLCEDGRTNVKLVTLPHEMTRAAAAMYFLENVASCGFELTDVERGEVLNVIQRGGSITRLHGWHRRKKVA